MFALQKHCNNGCFLSLSAVARHATIMVYNYTIPRRPPAASYKGPGPCYMLPGLTGQIHHDPRSVFFKRPAYIFGLRTDLSTKFKTPTPYYIDPKIHREGRDACFEYTMAARREPVKPFNTPGPGTYSPGMSTFCSIPAYSLGMRTRLRRLDSNPAPNAYTMPPMLAADPLDSKKRRAPCYSLVGHCKMGGFSQDFAKAPAPGTYNVTCTDIYKARPPHYSMGTGAAMPGDRSTKPGPGAYSPQYTSSKPEEPSFSFGLHHSPYISMLMDDGTVGI